MTIPTYRQLCCHQRQFLSPVFRPSKTRQNWRWRVLDSRSEAQLHLLLSIYRESLDNQQFQTKKSVFINPRLKKFCNVFVAALRPRSTVLTDGAELNLNFIRKKVRFIERVYTLATLRAHPCCPPFSNLVRAGNRWLLRGNEKQYISDY